MPKISRREERKQQAAEDEKKGKERKPKGHRAVTSPRSSDD